MKNAKNTSSSKSTYNSNNILVISITVLVTALVVSGAMYGCQKSKEKKLQKQIQILQNEINTLNDSPEISKNLSSSEAQALIEERANEVIQSIKDKNMQKFAEFVHPDVGVRFSPYSFVEMEKDVKFEASQLPSLLSDATKYTWGEYDGIGGPIALTFDEYYKRFIYEKDYLGAKEIGYNKLIGGGNTTNNNFEVYPDAIIVEYYLPGIDPKFGGLDWGSLRLVFENKDGVWYVVGIINDQWTI